MWFWDVLWHTADLALSIWPWSTRDQDAKSEAAPGYQSTGVTSVPSVKDQRLP